MAIKNNLSIFFESIYNLYNQSYSRIKNNNKYFFINNQFQIIYIINTESKLDIQNRTNNNNIKTIIKNINIDINYYSIIIMIIIIFVLQLILIKNILNHKKIK